MSRGWWKLSHRERKGTAKKMKDKDLSAHRFINFTINRFLECCSWILFLTGSCSISKKGWWRMNSIKKWLINIGFFSPWKFINQFLIIVLLLFVPGLACKHWNRWKFLLLLVTHQRFQDLQQILAQVKKFTTHNPFLNSGRFLLLQLRPLLVEKDSIRNIFQHLCLLLPHSCSLNRKWFSCEEWRDKMEKNLWKRISW